MTEPTPPLTAESARALGEFSLYRKTARTLISDFTVPPGTPYQTPEGLRAEDEETRCAFDVQGGVYPIRESVFQQSYTLDAARQPAPSEGLREAVEHRIAELTVIEQRLAEVYRHDSTAALWVARICDEALDRSGGLLGRVRALARQPAPPEGLREGDAQ